MENQIEIYRGSDGQTQIEVRFEGDTFWLPLQQISELFERDKSVVSRHIKNIYKEGELVREATVAKNATVQKEGKRKVEKVKKLVISVLNRNRLFSKIEDI
ncbi:MAG: hypothetical protein R6V72_15650 [Cyclobacterium sp.]|uniref:hypothetical protein n=1 Tax=Cyclobacterium sp. TaxID=1966343 RepID=UPI003970DE93